MARKYLYVLSFYTAFMAFILLYTGNAEPAVTATCMIVSGGFLIAAIMADV